LSEKKSNKFRIKHSDFHIDISQHAGFCFGVVNAIKKAEENLANQNRLYCVGSIVHNAQEVARLTQKGVQVIDIDKAKKLNNQLILFRAHGEPPESYDAIKQTNNTLIDATCPVVLKIQQRIKKAWQKAQLYNGQIVLFGKKNHPEVIGLLGQTNFKAILIEHENDIHKIDFHKPVELFSQTTKSLEQFNKIAELIKQKAKSELKINDTICRQVSNRNKQLQEFSKNFELVYFVGDPQSSNSKVLFESCKKTNPNTLFITSELDIDKEFVRKYNSFGICGATSTPQWLMEKIALTIEQIKLNQQ